LKRELFLLTPVARKIHFWAKDFHLKAVASTGYEFHWWESSIFICELLQNSHFVIASRHGRRGDPVASRDSGFTRAGHEGKGKIPHTPTGHESWGTTPRLRR